MDQLYSKIIQHRLMMGLPRHCSASGMFSEAHTDDFVALIATNYKLSRESWIVLCSVGTVHARLGDRADGNVLILD